MGTFDHLGLNLILHKRINLFKENLSVEEKHNVNY